MSANNATSNNNSLEVVISSPTALSVYEARLEQRIRFREIEAANVKKKRSHLRILGHLLDVPLDTLVDPYGPGMEQLLEDVEALTVEWANAGLEARTIHDRHEELVFALKTALHIEGHDTGILCESLRKRLVNVRRAHSPAKQKPWSPSDDDIATLFQFVNDAISGKVPAPGGRYNAKTKTWTRAMSKEVLLRARAVMALAISTAARTGELLALTRSEVTKEGVSRTITKGREGDVVTSKIDPALWPYVEAWLNAMPKDAERLFPAGQGTVPTQINALMRQAGWEGKGKHIGLYSFRRWSLSKLQQAGASDHVIMSVSGHRSKESMRTYLAPHVEQDMRDTGTETLAGLITKTLGLSNLEEVPDTIQTLLHQLEEQINLYSASEVKAIRAIGNHQQSLQQPVQDVLVVRGGVTFSLEDEGASDMDERLPHLKDGAQHFTQRLGHRLRAVRPLGTPVQAHGQTVVVHGDGLKKDHGDEDAMNDRADGEERPCRDSNAGSSLRRRG